MKPVILTKTVNDITRTVIISEKILSDGFKLYQIKYTTPYSQGSYYKAASTLREANAIAQEYLNKF